MIWFRSSQKVALRLYFQGRVTVWWRIGSGGSEKEMDSRVFCLNDWGMELPFTEMQNFGGEEEQILEGEWELTFWHVRFEMGIGQRNDMIWSPGFSYIFSQIYLLGFPGLWANIIFLCVVLASMTAAKSPSLLTLLLILDYLFFMFILSKFTVPIHVSLSCLSWVITHEKARAKTVAFSSKFHLNLFCVCGEREYVLRQTIDKLFLMLIQFKRHLLSGE